MKQPFLPPGHCSRRSGSLLRSGRHPVVSRRFTLQVRLRGETGPICEVRCAGLEEAIHFGQREFPAFAERNPWIGLDWLQGRIWILLDPETDCTGS
jgi:hypothetical protein